MNPPVSFYGIIQRQAASQSVNRKSTPVLRAKLWLFMLSFIIRIRHFSQSSSPLRLTQGKVMMISTCMTSLSVTNDLLNLGIHSAHLLVKLRVVAPHDLRIPTGSNKDGLDTARNRGRKDVGDLESDEERERHDDCCVLTVTVVRGVGEVQVEVGQETASVCDEEAAERKNGSDEAVLHKLAVHLKRGRLYLR